jgi:MFS family permease
MMIISQASPIAQQMMGFTPAQAAAVVSILAFFNMSGRLASGMLSDRLGAIGTMRLTFGLSILAGLLLFFCRESTAALFYAGLALAGFGFGSIMGIYPGFTAKQFGRKYNSVNYGIMFIGFALAGLLGPMLMNTVVSATGRYQPAFIACAVLAAVGEVLINLFTRTAEKG